MIIFVSSSFSVQQVVQEKQTLSSKPVIGSSSSSTVGNSEQTQSLSSSAGHSALSKPSLTYSNSSAAIGNSSSSSKSSSRGRRATSSSSLSDKTTETSQSSSCSSRPQSRSWRRSDPPEPGIGLRRSQRLKETTGSCASNRYEMFVKSKLQNIFYPYPPPSNHVGPRNLILTLNDFAFVMAKESKISQID